MPTGYQIDDPAETYFLTFTVVEWVDIFSRKIYRDILLDSLTFCRQEKGLQIWGYTIMTNHMHCILRARDGNLPDIIHDFKRYTASKIIQTIDEIAESRKDWLLYRFRYAAKYNSRNSHHQFWMHDNHAEWIWSEKFFLQKLNYIHQNPVKAGWVARPEDWLYSSMRNYMGLPALMEIDVSDFSLTKWK